MLSTSSTVNFKIPTGVLGGRCGGGGGVGGNGIGEQ
jgi:hypothetical protein